MRVRRTFNDEFKAKIVETIAAGAARFLLFNIINIFKFS